MIDITILTHFWDIAYSLFAISCGNAFRYCHWISLSASNFMAHAYDYIMDPYQLRVVWSHNMMVMLYYVGFCTSFWQFFALHKSQCENKCSMLHRGASFPLQKSMKNEKMRMCISGSMRKYFWGPTLSIQSVCTSTFSSTVIFDAMTAQRT